MTQIDFIPNDLLRTPFVQVNFEHEDHEMKILSEDETMISTSVGSEMSLRSPLEELPRPNPRGNSPMR